jgi:uncharacterized protein (TIGR02996 family)
MDPGLLSEIHAHPGDDAPRLVLADALQSVGDARGELIAVQCELARLGAPPGRLFQEWIGDGIVSADISTLRKREVALLRKHGEEWTRAAQRFAVPDGVKMRRGFVEHVRWDCARHFSRGLSPLLAVAPLVQTITFATQLRSGSLAKFYARPELENIRELYVPAATSLAQARLQLTRLDVHHTGGPHELRDVATAPWFGQLHALTLSSFGLDADDIAALLKPMCKLVELQLISSRCGMAAAEVLAASPVASKLEILSLRHARLASGDVAKLLRAPRWPALAALDLRSNTIDSGDIAAIETLPALRVLNVANTKLDDTSARALERLKTKLRSLDARDNAIGAARKTALKKAFTHARLAI